MTQLLLPVVAIVSIVLTGAACGTATSSAVPSRSPAIEPTAQPSAATTITPAPTLADDWRPVPEQASVQGVQFHHVVWTGTRFVATGGALDGDGAFLDSADGLVWHRQPGSTAAAFPDALAVGPTGVVAVGTIDDHPASWFSPDGLTWNVKADAFPMPHLGTDTASVTSVASTPAGWLAVGVQDPMCHVNCGLTPVRALVWTSSDGLQWVRVADQASFDGAGMSSVVEGGPGFVAAGSSAGHAAIWTSADGSTWSRVADDPMFHARHGTDPSYSTAVSGLATGHGLNVAVGMDAAAGGGEGGAVRAWWSADGRTWAEATGDRFQSGQVFSVATTPEGFLATGPSGEQSCLGGIWASSDGRDWSCVASDSMFAGFGPYAAAASSSCEVAVGLESLADPPPAGLPGAVWQRTLP